MQTQLDKPTTTTAAQSRARLPAEWRFALGLVGFYQLVLLGMGLVLPNVPYCAQQVTGAFEQWLLGAWLRYDTCHYIIIARDGYGAHAGSTAFHPLFPLLMSAMGKLLGGQYLVGGWLVSAICCTAMLALFYRLVLLDYDNTIAKRSAVFLMASPLGFSFLIPYTEAVLMLCVVGAFLAARQGRWALAGLAGFGAALTKQPGVALLLPLLWELWLHERHNLRERRVAGALRGALWLGLTPFGLLVFLLFRATLGDVAFDWSNPISLVDALLVTPQYREVWQEYFSWPWVNFLLAVEVIATKPYFYIVLNTALMLAAVAVIVAGIRRWRTSYTIFTVLISLLNLAIVYPAWPYMGIVRRFTIIFPIFIQLALWSRRPLVRLGLLIVCGSLWLLIVLMYINRAFVP